MHLRGAADRSCDHWHDDAGIVNHHVGITWLLETSLRAIDPTTAAHYWDYTVDAADLGADWAASFVFSEEWFGSANPDTKDHAVADSKFAFTRVLSDAAAYSNWTNPYGLLRSPWNTNPVPFLLRSAEVLGLYGDGYGSFPSCADFASVLRTDSLGAMLHALNGQLHGPVHIMVGGHWGFDEETWRPYLSTQLSTDYWLLLAKFLWRQGVVRCPATCAADAPPEACACGCPALEDGADAEALLDRFGVLALAPPQGLWLAKLRAEGNFSAADGLRLLCQVGHPGELFTSAAPQDPLFWPLHGLAERYLQLLRTWHRNGTYVLNETWGYAHSKGVLSDTRLVCDWRGVAGETMPNCSVGLTCAGHRAADVLPFDWPVPADVVGARPTYTNAEFYDLIAPWDLRMPYVYDRLSSWPACPGGQIQPHNGG